MADNVFEFNKNDKQQHFNQIKGIITELNEGDTWCSITLKVGHENERFVNLVAKNSCFSKVTKDHKIGDKVIVMFYLTSRFKNDRYYTTAHVLQVDKY
jgi:hypothetical protein